MKAAPLARQNHARPHGGEAFDVLSCSARLQSMHLYTCEGKWHQAACNVMLSSQDFGIPYDMKQAQISLQK